MTLRRCTDGVFAAVNDAAGAAPVAGAELHAEGLSHAETTDAQGVAFAHVYAAGDCPLVVEKDGRFAVAGFGKVFEGLYVSQWESEWQLRGWRNRVERLRKIPAENTAAVFADRTVVAAYTDRPTYRPGQEVNFKLIVRTLEALVVSKVQAGSLHHNAAFRAADFDLESQLQLFPDGTPLNYSVISPRGRIVASGALALNDYGTAAGHIALSAEDPVGAYSLRLHVGDADRVVPNVFAVKYYRRPNFQLTLGGVPATLAPGQTLSLALKGEYFFGKPVANGVVEARLVRIERWNALAEASATFSDSGACTLKLELPAVLPSGKYAVVCTLRDESGQTVSRSEPCEVLATPSRPKARGVAALPRFVKLGTTLTIETSGAEIAVEHGGAARKISAVDHAASVTGSPSRAGTC